MYPTRSSAFVFLVLLSACKDKEGTDTGDSVPAETGDTAIIDTAETGDTALDDEELPESTVTIEEDLIWDEDVSLGSVIYIPEGVTLTVLAGVNVAFQPGSGIVVDGTILLQGNEDSLVNFGNDYSLSSSNYGLNVGGSGDTSILNYAAFTGINVTLEGDATDILRNSTFSDSTLTVLSRDQLLTVDSCAFTDNARDGQTSIVARDMPELLVTDSSFSDGAYGVYFNGLIDGATVTVTDSRFDAMSTAVIVGNQGEYAHTVNLSNLDVTNSTSYAIALYRSDATVENVNIDGSLSHGLYTDALSNLSTDELSVTNTDGSCLQVLGSAQLKRTEVSDCGTHGIYLGEYGATITESSVYDVDNVGIYSAASLTVSDTLVEMTPGHGIYAANGALTVTDVTVTDAKGSGIYVEKGDLNATGSTVTDISGNGFYASYGDIIVSDVTADGVRGQGIYSYRGNLTVESGSSGTRVRDVEGSGVYANDGDLNVTDLTISDVRGYGVYVYYGDATVTDTVISSALSGGIYAVRGDISVSGDATGVEISDVDGVGIYASTGNIVASDVEISNVRSHGVYSAYGSTLLSNASVNGAGGIGVYAIEGDITADDVDLASLESHGFYAKDGDVSITGSTVATIDGVGAYVSGGMLTVDGLSVEDSGSYGIYVLEGTGDISDVDITGTLNQGILGSLADLVLSGVSVSDSGSHGIQVSNGDLDATNSSVANTEGHGFYVADGGITLTDVEVANVRSSGAVVSVGEMYIDGIVVQDAAGSGESTGDNGVSASDATATITNASISDTGAIGISAEQADISYSEIITPTSYGIYISGHDAASIQYTDVTDAGYHAVLGISWGENLLDISYCNITGAYGWGVAYAQSVDNNYIANNSDETGADTTNEGTLDGTRDAATDQVTGADAISNARSSAVSGTGPR